MRTTIRFTALHLAGIAALSLGLTFWPTLVSMIHIWNTSDTYAHGWLIPPISLYLLYQMRDTLNRIEPHPAWWALAPISLVGFVWMLAYLVDVQVVQQLMLVSLVIGVVLLIVGWRWCVAAAFPLGFLYLAVPLGDGLTPHLVDMTADFVVHALRLTGIPVYREGTLFVIPSGTWSVVSGCSGMRYLMATITVGVLFAYLNYRSMYRRIAFVGVAILVSILANWLRAYGIVMIAHLSGMKLALGVDHYIYGWVFFGVVIFLLMAIGMVWSEVPTTNREPLPSVTSAARPGRMTTQILGAFLMALFATHLWPLAANIATARTVHERPELDGVMASLPARWQIQNSPTLDWHPHFVGSPLLLERSFVVDGIPIGLKVAWYGEQSQGEELVHAANELVREKSEPLRKRSENARQSTVAAMPAVIETVLQQRNGTGRILVWQSNWTDGRFTNSRLVTKLLEVRSRLSGRGNSAAAVILHIQLPDDELLESQRKRLADVAKVLAPKLNAAFERAASPGR